MSWSVAGLRYDQANVQEICRDRALVTPEKHAPNDFYGQASVIKRYAGLPEDVPLMFVVEHGIRLDESVWVNDARSRLATIGAASNRRASVLRQTTDKYIVPIGFGYLYARELVNRDVGSLPEGREGTLVFPPHSTHGIRAVFDHEAYARMLAGLAEEFQPVVVCGYWKDVLADALGAYVRHGLPLVSAGHIFDRDFLLRLHDLCRRFRFATANTLGTHLFAATASGCRFFYSGDRDVHYEVPQSLVGTTSMLGGQYDVTEEESRRLFAEPGPRVSREQAAFVWERIGEGCMLTPEAMRAFARESAARQRTAPLRWISGRLADWWTSVIAGSRKAA